MSVMSDVMSVMRGVMVEVYLSTEMSPIPTRGVMMEVKVEVYLSTEMSPTPRSYFNLVRICSSYCKICFALVILRFYPDECDE